MFDYFPKIHPRVKKAEEADLKFRKFMLDLDKEYDLTYGEILRIISSYLATKAKYMVRSERHGNVNEPGDTE